MGSAYRDGDTRRWWNHLRDALGDFPPPHRGGAESRRDDRRDVSLSWRARRVRDLRSAGAAEVHRVVSPNRPDPGSHSRPARLHGRSRDGLAAGQSGQLCLCRAEHAALAAARRLARAVSVLLRSDGGHRPLGKSRHPGHAAGHHRGAGKEDRHVGLPRQPARLAAGVSRRGRIPGHDAPSRGRRGKLLGVAAAEGFVQHRGHPYPQDDLLHALFSSPEKE